MEVRAARRDDLAAVAVQVTESWRSAYAGLMPQALLDSLDPRRRQAGMERVMDEGLVGQAMSVALDGSQIVGSAWVGPDRADDTDGTVGEVLAIYVASSYWGKGYGYALMERSKEDMRRLGYRSAMLWVLHDNERAQRFYERNGWQRDSAIKLEEWGAFQLQEVRYIFPSL